MFEALEPCCAQAFATLKPKTTAKSSFPICVLPVKAAIVPDEREPACSLRWSVIFISLCGGLAMIRTLLAIAVAGAFAVPVAASAANDNILIAQGGAGGDPGATNRQEGASPPGQASPGAPRSTTSG